MQHYSSLGTLRPSALHQIATYIKAPIGTGAEDYSPSASAVLLYVAVGLFFCWFGGMGRMNYKRPLLDFAVIQGAIWCLWISVAYSLLFARIGIRICWNMLPAVFCCSALWVAGYFYIDSNASAPWELVFATLGFAAIPYFFTKFRER